MTIYNQELGVNEYYANHKNGKYASNVVGNYIVNGATNEKYPYKVGSKEENYFFKVKDTTMNAKFEMTRDSNTYYFETPYQYMEFRDVVLDDIIIENWKMKISKLPVDK